MTQEDRFGGIFAAITGGSESRTVEVGNERASWHAFIIRIRQRTFIYSATDYCTLAPGTSAARRPGIKKPTSHIVTAVIGS
jgi:hypothetical protein